VDEYHRPVLLADVLVYLGLTNALSNINTRFIDATLGAGGYTLSFCKQGVKVLAIDKDPGMINIAKARLEKSFSYMRGEARSYKLVRGNYSDIKKIAYVEGFDQVDGIVFDLGVATEQLTSPIRGFSFRNPGALLDMRLDVETQGVTASDLLNALDKNALKKLFSVTCDYREVVRLVPRILSRRETNQFATVDDFLEVTKGIFIAKRGVNPVTRAFMALRMAVNTELENLEVALRDSTDLLRSGGRLVVVSFHSGEDKIVKETFVSLAKEEIGKILTKSPVIPSTEELTSNPRARSAKLRVLMKN
jgi:16S rRNA (cytosine1402-N4)-methyltransferase